VTGPRSLPRPPAGVIPVTLPGDVVLVRAPALAVWAGAVTVFADSFAFTLLTLSDTRVTRPPESWALDVPQRSRETWLAVRFSDGRYRAADLNANTPPHQPQGPHVRFSGGQANWTDGWDRSRWWVAPLPPPGPVELAIHLNGQDDPTGVGYLDGDALTAAAARAQTLWTDSWPG
jgi:hypothetical protein